MYTFLCSMILLIIDSKLEPSSVPLLEMPNHSGESLWDKQSYHPLYMHKPSNLDSQTVNLCCRLSQLVCTLKVPFDKRFCRILARNDETLVLCFG